MSAAVQSGAVIGRWARVLGVPEVEIRAFSRKDCCKYYADLRLPHHSTPEQEHHPISVFPGDRPSMLEGTLQSASALCTYTSLQKY